MKSRFSSPDSCTNEYDPFHSPPDYTLALNHRKANLVGISKKTAKEKRCQCCMRSVNKQLLDLRCDHSELAFLGSPIVLYFDLLKAEFFLLFLLLLTSLLSTLITNGSYQCCSLTPQFLASLTIDHSAADYFIVVTWFLLVAAVLLLKRYTERQVYAIQKNNLSQSAFALKLSNLPPCEHLELKQWVADVTGERVVEIQIVGESVEMEQNFLKREELGIQMKKIGISRAETQQIFSSQNITDLLSNRKDQIQDISQQIHRLDQALNKYKQSSTSGSYKQIGIAFIMFQSAKQAQNALSHYLQLLRDKNGGAKANGKFDYRLIDIAPANNPTDIIWQNLTRFSPVIAVIFEIIAHVLGIAILVLIWLFVRSHVQLPETSYRNVLSLFVIFAFYCLFHLIAHLIVAFHAKASRFSVRSQQQRAAFRLYTFLNILLSFSLPYSLQHSALQLVYYVNFTLLIDAVMHPLIKAFNFPDIYRLARAQYIKKLQPHKNPYTQDYLNRLMEGRYFKVGQNYHYILRALFTSLFHCCSAPFGYLFYVVAIIGQYMIQKYLLLRSCKTPPQLSNQIIKQLVMGLSLLPMCFLIGNVIFMKKDHLIDIVSLDNILLLAFLFCGSIAVAVYIMVSVKRAQWGCPPGESYYASRGKFQQSYGFLNPINRYNDQILLNYVTNPENIYMTPEFTPINYNLGSEQISKDMPKLSHIRFVNRMLSYNTEAGDLQQSYQYRRLGEN